MRFGFFSRSHGDTVRTITACTVQQDGELYTPVSYTHLDVYKRQDEYIAGFIESQHQHAAHAHQVLLLALNTAGTVFIFFISLLLLLVGSQVAMCIRDRGNALGNGGFANAGFTDQAGVVFLAAAQNLHLSLIHIWQMPSQKRR